MSIGWQKDQKGYAEIVEAAEEAEKAGMLVVYANPLYDNLLLVPMDSRTTASPTGKDEYVFYRTGGVSWAIPYIAGMYALAAQVKPQITPQEFWKIALETGQTIEILHESQTYQLGPILDPVALIAAL